MATLIAYDSSHGSGGVKVVYTVSERNISWTFYVHTGSYVWQDRYFGYTLTINGSQQVNISSDNTYYSSYNTDYNKYSGTYSVPGTDAKNVTIAISCTGDTSLIYSPKASASTTASVAATAVDVFTPVQVGAIKTWVNDNGTWRKGIVWVNNNGKWIRATQVWPNLSGTWYKSN